MNDQITSSIDAVNFRVGAFVVDPRAGTLRNGGDEIHLSPRSTDVLVYLAERPGQTVSNDVLRDAFWRGAISAPNAVHKAVMELREALHDDARAPTYIQTLPRRGYRLIAPVEKLLSATPVTLQRPVAVDGDLVLVAGTNGAGVPEVANGTIEAASGTVGPRRERLWFAAALVLAVVVSASLAGFSSLAWKTDRATVAVDAPGPVAPIAACDCDIRVAMLPLRASDGRLDELAERIADGVRRGLANGYAKRVATRDESAPHTMAREALDGIAKTLIVNEVIDGEIAMAEGTANLSIALHHVEGQQSVYRFDAVTPWPSTPQSEEQLIAHLIRVLGVGLSGAEGAMKELGTRDAEAFLAYREGFDRAWRQEPEFAIRSFRKAIEFDPGFARAYYELGNALVTRADTTATLEARRAAAPELESLRARVAALHGTAWQLADLDDAILRWRGASRETREARLRGVMSSGAPDMDRFVPFWRYAGVLVSARLPETAGRYLDAAGRPNEWVLGAARAQIVELLDGPATAASMRHELLQGAPDNVSLAHGEIINLALSGDVAAARKAIEHLERIDAGGLWTYSARLQVAALCGDLTRDTPALDQALADPRATPLTRGIVRFTLGDVAGGAVDWRALDAPSLELIQQYIAGVERQFPASVLVDPRYQALLDGLDMGGRWSAYMRAQATALTAVTGIAADERFTVASARN